jgi:hypothetical protein
MVAAALTCSALAACAAQRIENREDLMAAAGFTVIPANTPDRESELLTLPRDRFVMRTATNGQLEYVFADPMDCNCLYVGNQGNYAAFRSELFQQHLANEAELTALTYQNAGNWNGWKLGSVRSRLVVVTAPSGSSRSEYTGPADGRACIV